eukprot:Amastigsp_a343746_44.p2 type:complete len:172 gc:universal Amastigsp_a343746_44:384-899(+)
MLRERSLERVPDIAIERLRHGSGASGDALRFSVHDNDHDVLASADQEAEVGAPHLHCCYYWGVDLALDAYLFSQARVLVRPVQGHVVHGALDLLRRAGAVVRPAPHHGFQQPERVRCARNPGCLHGLCLGDHFCSPVRLPSQAPRSAAGCKAARGLCRRALGLGLEIKLGR